VAQVISGMLIYDLSDPHQPQLLSTLCDTTNMGPIFSVTVSGYFAYLTGLYGVFVVDITDRAHPELIQKITGYGQKCTSIASNGFCLILPNMVNGIEVFDTFAPYGPGGVQFAADFSLPNWPADVAIEGNVAVATMIYAGQYLAEKYLIFYDISDLGNVTAFKKHYFLPGFNHGLEIKNGYIYVTDEESLLDVLKME
jgi:hypothetical protein